MLGITLTIHKESLKNMDVRQVVMTIIAITVGVLLVGTLLVPQAQSVIDSLTKSGQGTWASLIGVVVMISIIGLVLVSVYGFSDRK